MIERCDKCGYAPARGPDGQCPYCSTFGAATRTISENLRIDRPGPTGATVDAETRAMTVVCRELERLDVVSRQRVIRYLLERWLGEYGSGVG